MTAVFTHRIRRCKSNPDAFALVTLRLDGTEIEAYPEGTTALSVDGLLRRNREYLTRVGARIELHPGTWRP
jgi:hypothetical protein